MPNPEHKQGGKETFSFPLPGIRVPAREYARFMRDNLGQYEWCELEDLFNECGEFRASGEWIPYAQKDEWDAQGEAA